MPSEDAVATSTTAIAVADGATAKPADGLAPSPISAGRLAQFVADTAVASSLNGQALVDELNAAVARLTEAAFDVDPPPPFQPSSCTLACARIVDGRVELTIVGDTSIRVLGPHGATYSGHALVDELTSAARAHYIELTGDVDGSRDFIMPLLSRQSLYRNNHRHPLGFGVIDGTATPSKFVRTITWPIDAAADCTIEIFTDGYVKVPAGITVDDWERAHAQVVDEDPARCRTYPATKIKDDRTVVIATIEPF